MASITLTTVRDAVRVRGDFPRARKFTDDYMDREIQVAWTALHRVVERVNEGYWDKESNVTTVAAQKFIALPADARKIKGVDINDGGVFRELRQIAVGERNRYGTEQGTPEAYRLSERGIELFLTPDKAYTLRVTYSRKVTPLSATPVEVDEEWEDYVIWSAILKIGTSEERPVGDYQNAVDRAVAAITESATGRRQQEPEYVLLREYPPAWELY